MELPRKEKKNYKFQADSFMQMDHALTQYLKSALLKWIRSSCIFPYKVHENVMMQKVWHKNLRSTHEVTHVLVGHEIQAEVKFNNTAALCNICNMAAMHMCVKCTECLQTKLKWG